MSLYLSELLKNKKVLDKKIEELARALDTDQDEKLAKALFNLIDARQSSLLQIDAANHNSLINLSGTEVTITVAIIVRDTIKGKIEVLTSLIENEHCKLDKLELQHQRDKFYEEYNLLSMGIERNDLQVKIG